MLGLRINSKQGEQRWARDLSYLVLFLNHEECLHLHSNRVNILAFE